LQFFCENEGPIENYGSDLFHRDEVHKIAILDLRILNIDRNECNILVRTKISSKTGKKVRRLIPIDHGLSFPDSLAVCSYDLAWLSWRQAEEPFSKRCLGYINSIDI
jgi:Phosphatidylinositol 3- and 4-kinase